MCFIAAIRSARSRSTGRYIALMTAGVLFVAAFFRVGELM